ncbi:DNA repair protein Rev1 [Nymphalis io]|uniref:DNA repair protein Rev1 n=1 Tax=Inachis io TaxID=171585 RepID=UPI0021684833|nr:DNA repair protein Rev1 [Nymphalis io]
MRRREDKFPDNGFEAWGGYMHAKVAKLEEQFASGIGKECKQTDLFKGISIFVNGFTTPSADELKELMAKHGGVYHIYHRSEDFIIASNLPDTKVKKMSLAKVVKPQWIIDSIATQRVLDYKDYLLYRHSKSQGRLHFNQISKVEDQVELVKPEKVNDRCPYIKKSEQNNDKVCNSEKSISSDGPVKSLSLGITSKKSEVNTKTAADPNFISEFYNNSRLHHISQLGACFKQHVNDLRENSKFNFIARNDLKTRISKLSNSKNKLTKSDFQNEKTIMHIDMDCFFVSVGLRKRPELRGKPIAVTHSKGGQSHPKRLGVDRVTEFNMYKQKQAKKISKASGVPEEEIDIETRIDNVSEDGDQFGSMSEIASCSYEARAKGITNGMFMGAALRLCPDLHTIPYDFEEYKEVAYTLYNTIARYTLDIEAVSCDEMYVDCTELLDYLNVSVDDFATALREEIKSKTGCPCSTGFGGNRLQARLATKQAKPDGQFFLTSDIVNSFMYCINLKDLPGVGRQTSHKLESLGHQMCGSLQSLSLTCLQKHLGNKTGQQLYDQCRGHDPNPLVYYTVRKSVSAEVNYGIRFENNAQSEEFLKLLCIEVQSRMQQFKVMGKCITLKLMVRAENAPVETAKFMGHGFCDVINKSTTLPTATNDVHLITKEVISICRKQNIDPKEMRGIGIQVTKLETTNKQVKGSINKFLTNNTLVKSDKNKLEILKEDEKKLPTTPKKQNIHISPIKRSPTVGNMKSPILKRRGRPPKNGKLQIPTSHTPLGRFLQFPQIISEENNPKKEINREETKLVDIPKQTEEKQGLLGLPWDKVRDLLRAWFDSGQAPKLCDVNLISAYMREMVINKNIDKLYILVNFLRRRIREMNIDIWYEVQECVIDEVQNAMVAVYGKKLWINDQ